MKKALLFTVLLTFALSCSSSSDSDNRDVFIGLFTGKVIYSFENIVEDLDGSIVEVVKEDDLLYSFHFSNNIPAISNVEFDSNRGIIMNTDASETHLIRVTAKTLQIIFSDDEGNHWEAKCFKGAN